MESLLLFLATGAAAGILAGLFGVGGGLIMVPALAFLLPGIGVPHSIYMQVAIGTSLAVIGVTSLSSTLSHHRRGGVAWPAFARLAPGLALGALLGAWLAHRLGGDTLRMFVGTGALLVSAQMLFSGAPRAEAARPPPSTPELVAAGAVIGTLSSLVGIGGGSLTVPYFNLRGLTIRQAVGTAAACGVPIAWGGTLGFIVTGWHAPGLPQWTLGYVSVAGFLGLASASVLTAPLGAALAHRLPAPVLKRAFAVLLAIIGLKLLLG
jgi:uncharacterized membrane protein YfcA